MINWRLAGNVYNWLLVSLIVYMAGLLLAWGHGMAREITPKTGSDEISGE